MVFNDLSVSNQTKATDRYAAMNLMTGLVKTLVSAASYGIGKSLRTQENFYAMELAPNYTLSNWLTDNAVTKEEQSFLRTLSTKIPYLAGLESSAIAEEAKISDFSFQGQPASGLGISYLLDGLAVSILSSNIWDRSVITLTMAQLDQSGNITEEDVLVKHSARPSHLPEHQQWITTRRQDELRDVNDLWYRRQEFFPSLHFCEAVRDQIINLNPTNPAFRQIKKRMFEFQNYCNGWNDGPFAPDRLPSRTTTESSATLNRYSQQRTFRCPDGIDRVFSWHIRLTPGAWRIYFYPEENNKIIFIGYIGPHLSIVSEC